MQQFVSSKTPVAAFTAAAIALLITTAPKLISLMFGCSFFSNCLLAGCTNSLSPDQNTQPEVCPRLRVHLAVCITLPSPSFKLK